MTPIINKEEIIKIGNRFGFEIVKICSPKQFTDYEKIVKERIRAGLYPEELISYEEILKDVETYANPYNSLPDAKSIICMAFCYYTMEQTDLTKPGEPHGVLARAYQRDVYGEKHRREKQYAELLHKKGIKVAKRNLIPRKMAAIRAGIGWQGKNSLIITEEFGSWIALSNLIVNIELEPDNPLSKDCGSCQSCIRACPTSAIQAPGVINVNKCIDYLTCKTGVIPQKLRDKMGNRLVSCDCCQEACPYNKAVKFIKKDIPSIDPVYRHSPALLPLLSITEDDFRKYYLDCEFLDPRSESLQRNVIIALGNIGDPIAIPILQKCLKSTKSILREHAKWALEYIFNFKTN